MRQVIGRLGLVLGTSVLAGCGGGGGSTAVTPTPTATAPTPTPTPSPTPAPAPAPATSYASPTDYGAAFTFASSIGFAVDLFVPNADVSSSLGVYLLPADQTTRLAFAPQPETIDFNYAGSQASWTGTDRTDAGAQRFYRRGDDELLLGYEGGRSATYVTKAGFRRFLGAATLNGVAGRRARLSFGIVGPATAPAELPSSAAEFRGSSLTFGGLGFDRFNNRVDPAAFVTLRSDGVTLSGVANVNESSNGGSNTALILSGQLDRATGVVTGTIDTTDRSFAGIFRGRLFGPGGREIALAFFATRASDRAELAGEFIGRR